MRRALSCRFCRLSPQSCPSPACIIRSVLRSARHTYERLLLGMSLFDVFFSIHPTLAPFMAPSGYYALAVGNDLTCRMSGTAHQIGFASFFYYGCLSCYFLLVIRFSVSPETIAFRVEPFMHALSILWPVSSAIALAVKDWYGPMELHYGCWSDGLPDGKSVMINWICAVSWQLLVALSLIVNNIVIYRHVRQEYCASTLSVVDEESKLSNGRGSRETSNTSSSLSGGPEESQTQRLRQVATQCTLYACVYFLTHSPFLVLRAIENNYNSRSCTTQFYPLIVVQAVMTPLPGFFNALVFFRPRYLHLRKTNSKEHTPTRLQAMYRAMVFEARATSVRRRRRSTALLKSHSETRS